MKINSLIIILIILSVSCKNNQHTAREPISHEPNKVDMTSVNNNRNLNHREEEYIKQMIGADTLHTYIDSGHGFWYYYIDQNEKAKDYPQAGDKVWLQYEVRDLSNNVIYPETKKLTYLVDRENYFRGFREAVKLLKENEKAVFLFPSNSAYGYHGDEKEIGSNVPLKVYINILKVEKKEE